MPRSPETGHDAYAGAGVMWICLCFLAPLNVSPSPAASQQPATISARTAGLHRNEGFLAFYLDSTGRLLIEVPDSADDLLLANSLASGSGVWPVYRGSMPGKFSLVRFVRSGKVVLLVQHNTAFRADVDDAAMSAAIAESFAPSVLASMPIVAEEPGRLLVDASDFVLRGLYATRALHSAGQGRFRVERERSSVDVQRTRAFGINTEIEASLTLVNDDPPEAGVRYAPDKRSVVVREHYSFRRLPAPGYLQREHDVRMGFYPFVYTDFAGAPTDGYRRRFISRWRLEKRDPTAAVSEPVHPITFYLDRALPESYRSAYRDGLMYWNRALEAAGFRNAVRVEELPADADPMDARYEAVVLWLTTGDPVSGISQPIVDPRTGEILKVIIEANVFRSLEDHNTYAAYRPALSDTSREAEYLVQRQRWFIAHEAAHAMAWMAHNTIRPSVVGFESAPLEPTVDGRLSLDLAKVFPTEPTEYDRWAMRYAYSTFGSAEAERAGLGAIVSDGLARDLRYVDDYQASSNPRATGRLHGNDAAAELERELDVRRILLTRFGTDALRPGEPSAVLFQRLVPVYFRHRYAIAAAAKAIGGLDYRYSVRGDGQPSVQPISPQLQRRALELLERTLSPAELSISPSTAALIPPWPTSYRPVELEDQDANPESFTYFTVESPPITIPLTSTTFDPLSWARVLSDLVLTDVFDARRAARVVSLHAQDPRQPSLDEVIERFLTRVWTGTPPAEPRAAALRRVASRSALEHVIALADNHIATPEVRGAALSRLEQLDAALRLRKSADAEERAHVALARRDIRRALTECAAK
ncbi:MAG TPA: zinc-dependent metalloprotease [Gemmatimonadaceae bacterium]|nr:zinc-dependent metalloprotease [Gemmatimonadaceae bacterium]